MMGSGTYAAFVYGTTLRPLESDVAYGLQMRLSEKRSMGVPCPDIPYNEDIALKWIGFKVKLFYGLELPEDMRYRAWELPVTLPPRIVDPRLAMFREPSNAEQDGARAKWAAFAEWCRERGFHMREGRLLFVTDYD